MLPASGIFDQDANRHHNSHHRRLPRRLLSQVDRILDINELRVVTAGAVEAAIETW